MAVASDHAGPASRAQRRQDQAHRADDLRQDRGWGVDPAFEAREMPDERRAIATATELSRRHHGVIAWMRDAKPAAGEFGPPEELYRAGEIPDLD